MKNLVIITLVLVLGVGIIFIASKKADYWLGLDLKNFIASVFFVDSVTTTALRQKYAAAPPAVKLKILIVPGHDDMESGAAYQGVTEAKLNLEVGDNLYQLLANDGNFDVTLTRTKDGYAKEILEFINNNQLEITAFHAEHIAVMEDFVNQGLVTLNTAKVFHNQAPKHTARMLVGINKWANDHNYDLILHLHFNDYPGRRYDMEGKYSGFTIYVPDRQFSNAKASREIAQYVKDRLADYFAISNLKNEDRGIVDEQELIAIGSYNTLDPAVMLIEYGYIYEPQFTAPTLRPKVLEELAFRTYLGLKEFFENREPSGTDRQTTLLPYVWNNNLAKGPDFSQDILALQALLIKQGLYPPANKTSNDCSLRGQYGECTAAAVAQFQKRYGLPPAGSVGPRTRDYLNALPL